ncbi:type II toxin-antitoxin system VapC family toxin [Hymenobacter sp. BRD67]|uniref:type II toxin-antitoxin system VapC family toxin n=1 Tax=Hymenobacter sp. BRD67 TaxID=2675877 RepID=UPI0015662EDE|nr:type II toxin-antitoxin system VapC family toxin [Hymenobacter sp. BRD67]QKG51513.1 type II toxin-antitoxin system VapC family toxin [Hymenobacter sp. BRD67]
MPARLLLDAHALVWYADNSLLLPEALRHELDDVQNECVVSIASFWELATLTNLGRITLLPDLATLLAQVRANGFRILPLEDAHLVCYAALPQVLNHRDPFDRLLIAQAPSEDLTLISRDNKFAQYPGLKVRWN